MLPYNYRISKPSINTRLKSGDWRYNNKTYNTFPYLLILHWAGPSAERSYWFLDDRCVEYH